MPTQRVKFDWVSDKELLQAIEHKDERAFNIFYEKYARGLAQFALKCTRNENLTKDIVQLFWIRLWENPMEIKTDESGSAYRYLTKFFTFRITAGALIFKLCL